ncbi:MAG TPA: hypothetical protein VFB60_26860 [Ktedonobacteraceae bacterium]|nr:hypothetical protein [Ktedonobacteraceae bacterium]
MKSLAFLEQVDHKRKLAIYVAEHDGKMRNFAYQEELGECRETFARLFQDVQKGEIGVIMTYDATCLSIETSPSWMEAFIQVIKRHNVLIADRSHDLVYDLCDEEDEARFRNLYSRDEYEKERNEPRALIAAVAQSPFSAASIEKDEDWFLITEVGKKDKDTSIYSLSSGAKGKDTDMWGIGPLKELLDTLAPYGITEEDGWSPVHAERKSWLSRIQQQEDKMAEQATAVIKPHRDSLPKEAQVRVVLNDRSKIRSKKRRK